MAVAAIRIFALLLSLGITAGAAQGDFSEKAHDRDPFGDKEKSRLARADSLEERIRIYADASERFHKEIRNLSKHNSYEEISDALQTWRVLLLRSLDDIRMNTRPKKKRSKGLIKYEIHLRKSIADMIDIKLSAPVELSEAFDAFMADAENARTHFMDILFPR